MGHPALWKRKDALLGVVLIVVGLAVNYLLEHHTFLRPGMLSPRSYLGAWPDVFLPSVAFFLVLSGVVLVAIGVKRYILPPSRTWRFWPAFVIAAVLTIPYLALYVGMQFVATGADRLGECAGLDAAATVSRDIPDSSAFPGKGAAVGCAVERYGMFLSFYNDLTVYGVTDSAAQDRVLENLRNHRKIVHTHPLHVAFYEGENWFSWRNERSGTTGGHRGPERLLRIATLW